MSQRSPSYLKKLRWKLAALYQRHWRGDEFLAQHRLWLAAEGDRKLRLDYDLGPESAAVLVDHVQCFDSAKPEFADYPSKAFLIAWEERLGFSWHIEQDIFVARR
jgi:hypothetical protein